MDYKSFDSWECNVYKRIKKVKILDLGLTLP